MTGRRRRAHALLVAIVAVTVVGVLPQAASADQIGDKQAQANAIAAKVDELNHTIERFAEQANAAQLELDQLTQQVADAQAKVEAAKAEQDQHRGELRSYAIDAYVHGTDDHSAQLAASTDLTDLGQRQGYLSAASGNRQQLIDQLRATEEDVQIQIGQLNDAQAKAAAKKKDLSDRKASAANAAAQQQQLLNQAQGELATLVKAAQAKKAADDAASASARARTSNTGGGASFGPAPSPHGGAGAAIAEARRQLGKPYVWGAAGPDSFDCSGLTLVGVARRWRQPPALLRRAVLLHHAHPDVGDSAGRPHLLRESRIARCAVHRRRPDHPCAALRRRRRVQQPLLLEHLDVGQPALGVRA